MTVLRQRGIQVAVGLAVLVALAVGAGTMLGGDDDGPADTATAFTAAWTEGDAEALRGLVVDPAALDAVDPVESTAALGATETTIEVGDVQVDGDRATAAFAVRLELGELGDVDWSSRLSLVELDDGWRVDWTEGALHPGVPPGGGVRRSVSWPARAPILGAGDEVVIGPVETIRIGIEPQRFDRVASIPILAEQLQLDPTAIEAALDGPGVQPDHFVQIAELRPEEFERIRAVVFPIPGVTFPRGTTRGGPTTGFARHVAGRFDEVTAERLEELGPPYRVGDLVGLDGLEARYERQLAGAPAVEIRVVDAEGEVVEVVASFPSTPPTPVRTTLDPAVQRAAEVALAEVTVPSALVAVDVTTGEIRASASRPLGESFDRALGGAYPPGSTFKVVTGYALLANGTRSGTTVDCPVELVVDGRAFGNFEGGAAGAVPFARAFADSCNTAIIGAAADLPDGALAEAAAAFGFGVDYSVGPTTLGGAFPEPDGAVERAAAAIGQAEVTASPLHMATVAAAVRSGTWRTPLLLPDEADPPTSLPLDGTIVSELRELMRLVVTDGSGRAAAVPGVDLLGKTGTAEFGQGDPLPTHAWFVAATEDLGIAVVLEGGGVGGRDAAPIVARFLEALAG